MRARFRNAAIAIAIIAVTWSSPGSLLATLSNDGMPGDHSERVARLTEVRELSDRRRALLRELARQTEALDVEVIDLKRKRQEEDAALVEARARIETLEKELDHLVPRLLAREAEIRARREGARRALANLADVSREAEIDPELRARLLAVSPVMLERLRGAEASATNLRKEEERHAAEHRRLLEQAPLLLETRQRIEAARARAQLRRDAIASRMADVRAEVDALEQEQKQLAELVSARQDADRARAEPQADEPMGALALAAPRVHQFPRSAPGQAAIWGRAPHDARLSEGAEGSQPNGAPVRARGEPRAPKLAADATVRTVVGPPPAKPRGIDTPAATSVAAGFAEAPQVDEAGPVARTQLSSAVSPARLEVPSAPMLPVPGEVIAGGQPRLVRGETDPALVIAARAGQVVAAPETGRVVFAGKFKRYGLLLMIEHAPDYHTLLWGFSELRVQRGDHVRTGQIVGVMGMTRDGLSNLHMEVRRNGQPVNPLLWMAASNSKVQG